MVPLHCPFLSSTPGFYIERDGQDGLEESDRIRLLKRVKKVVDSLVKYLRNLFKLIKNRINYSFT